MPALRPRPLRRCVDDELPDVLRMRHTVELHVCGGAVREPFLGELVNIGGLAERYGGALSGYLNVEEIRNLALILYFPALRELAHEGGV